MPTTTSRPGWPERSTQPLTTQIETRPAMLSSTLQAELALLERRRQDADALEVFAACLRLREPAQINLQCGDNTWAVTVFVQQMTYYSPRSTALITAPELATLRVQTLEAPAVRTPGPWMHMGISGSEHYQALPPLLWMLALQGPRSTVLNEVAGAASYRALRSPSSDALNAPGALGGAIERLRRQSVPLRIVAGWPGMSIERASRLINALYLTSNLIVSRAAQAAQPSVLRSWFGRAPR